MKRHLLPIFGWAMLIAMTGLLACPKPPGPELLAEAHYHKGMEHWRNGDLEVALFEMQEAVRGDAKLVRAHHAMGEIWLALRRPTEAEAAFLKAVTLEPRKAAAWLGLGNARRALHRPDQAIAAYRTAIEIEPDAAAPYRFLGDVFASRLEVDAAVEAYREAARRAKGGEGVAPLEQLARLFEARERHGDAADAYAAVLEASESADVQAREQLAHLKEQGRKDEARLLTRQVAEARTVRSIRLVHLGDLNVEAGRLKAALTAYREAIALTPDDAPTWELVAAVQTAQGDAGAARSSYERAQALAPTSASPWVGLAELEMRVGNPDAARAALVNAVKVITGEAPDLLLARVAALFSGTGDHAKAVVIYEDLLTDAKDDVGLWVGLAGEQRALGERAAAEVSCAQARKAAAKADAPKLGVCAAR